MNYSTEFEALGLSEAMLKAIASKGFEKPSPIQALTIPFLLNNEQDVIAQAQTGTGKTAAFGLPILEKLESRRSSTQALILVPTRELAIQVTEELISFNSEKKLSIASIYGGASMNEQLRRLKKGIDIVVGTPGRILDHLRRSTLDLSEVKYMVLDEADEMLNMGFIDDVEAIIAAAHEDRQVMLFSATMPDRIASLAKRHMRNAEVLKALATNITTDLTNQIYFEVRDSDKFDALTRIIDIEPDFYGIVFCQTKIAVDEVSKRLTERGYASEGLHGDISQGQREKVLRGFRSKQITILVATDVAARGIDVNNLTHVINYSLPQDSESYVHRIGRTGRAGNQGTAITFISNAEMRRFGFLKRDIKVEIHKEKLPSVQDIIEIKKNKIKDDIIEIIDGDDYEKYLAMSQSLLELYSPEVALSAMMRLAFKNDLDENNYPEIRTINVDRRGTTRLFLSIGRTDGYDKRKMVAFLKRETGLSDAKIDDVKILDSFSFVTVPFQDAETVVKALNELSTNRPIAEVADDMAKGKSDGGNRGGRDRRFGGGDRDRKRSFGGDRGDRDFRPRSSEGGRKSFGTDSDFFAKEFGDRSRSNGEGSRGGRGGRSFGSGKSFGGGSRSSRGGFSSRKKR
ncbi:MAG: DEAD/DEAH box helicase [Rikenellaceae bacterium]